MKQEGNGPPADGSHSAPASALGYLYQAKVALLELLKAPQGTGNAAVSIEIYDDVAFEADGTPTELLQTKHHVGGTGNLTDASPDLWRTIGAWLDAGSVREGPLLTLLTTDKAQPGSAAEALRPSSRDAQRALRILEQTASSSSNDDTKSPRERFLRLSSADRLAFVERIRVLDQNADVSTIDRSVEYELRWAKPAQGGNAFVERLWGWWFGRVVANLRGEFRSITVLDLGAFLEDLRQQFAADNLPTFEELELHSEDIAAFDQRPFVHQLRWVDAPDAQLRRAVLDYYRAYSHSAKWLEESLIGLAEVQRFEERLIEEWEVAFSWALKRLPEPAKEQDKIKVGQELLRSTLDQTQLRIRDRFSDPFLSRGKHHELADIGSVGWHPDFKDRLGELLFGKSA